MVRWIAALTVLVGTLAMVGRASAASQAPAYGPDFPDPFVLRMSGTDWAYATGSGRRNLQVIHSTDLNNWSAVSDPLPVLPSWATSGLTWAPGVLRRGRTYVMYYTVHNATASPTAGRQCISVATSSTPGGPFTDTSSAPFICQTPGSIDANPYVAPNGYVYLLWKSDDNALGNPTHLWAQRLSSNGRSLLGAPVNVLSEESESWQSPVIEGPTIVANGGTFYLFYGAGNWDSAGASIGYATCASPLGPCANQSTSGPWLATNSSVVGPSGPSVFTTSSGTTMLAYHAWTGAIGYPQGARSMYINTLSFVGGQPVIG